MHPSLNLLIHKLDKSFENTIKLHGIIKARVFTMHYMGILLMLHQLITNPYGDVSDPETYIITQVWEIVRKFDL